MMIWIRYLPACGIAWVREGEGRRWQGLTMPAGGASGGEGRRASQECRSAEGGCSGSSSDGVRSHASSLASDGRCRRTLRPLDPSLPPA